MQTPCLACDPMNQRSAPSVKDAKGSTPCLSNNASEPTTLSDAAKSALRMGFAFWGALSIVQAFQFQWGFWGPHNVSGVAITLFFCLLHGHCIIVEDSRCAKRFVQPSLAFDFLAALALALGCFIRFVSGQGLLTTLQSLTLLLVALGACIKLASLLGSLSEPT